MAPKITVYTFIGHNSTPYAENLHSTMEFCKSGYTDIIYKCYRTVNNHQYPDEPLPVSWQHMGDVEAHKYSNSASHALSLNTAVADIKEDNGGYVVLCDADIAILHPNWDLMILSMLNLYSIFTWENRYGYPSPFFIAMHKLTWDTWSPNFMPLLEHKSERCKKKVIGGRKIKCDTGYKIMDDLIMCNNNINVSYCKRVLGGSLQSKLPFRNHEQRILQAKKPSHMAEYHLGKTIFGTHLQACRSDGIDSEYGKCWIDRINLKILENDYDV